MLHSYCRLVEARHEVTIGQHTANTATAQSARVDTTPSHSPKSHQSSKEMVHDAGLLWKMKHTRYCSVMSHAYAVDARADPSSHAPLAPQAPYRTRHSPKRLLPSHGTCPHLSACLQQSLLRALSQSAASWPACRPLCPCASCPFGLYHGLAPPPVQSQAQALVSQASCKANFANWQLPGPGIPPKCHGC